MAARTLAFQEQAGEGLGVWLCVTLEPGCPFPRGDRPDSPGFDEKHGAVRNGEEVGMQGREGKETVTVFCVSCLFGGLAAIR